MRKGLLVIVLLGLGILLTACPGGGLGKLTVNISGLPSGVAAEVSVAGPAGFSEALSASKTLSNLKVGQYTVSAVDVEAAGISYQATVTGSPASVVANGTTTVNVSYETNAGSLEVTISGLPSGVAAEVTVSGPNSFSETLTESTVLTALEPGSYSVSAEDVSSASNSYTATVSGSPATVNAGETATVSVSYAPKPGSLELTIDGLDTGLDANILVTGPNGFSETVTQSTTLSLEPGTYTLSANPVRSSNPIVSEHFTAVLSATSVDLDSDETTVASATYSKVEGSGQVWIPTVTTTIITSYTAAQLTLSGSPAPAVSFTAPSVQTHETIAFDEDGNMWVGLSGVPDSFLKKYSSSDLASSGSPSPAVIIGGDSLEGPYGLAFDAAGNLWVINFFANTLLGYSPDQLSSSGSPTPIITISADAGSLDGPDGLAFDKDGNLWITNFNANTLIQYTPDQLAASGSPTPAITISADAASSLNGPVGIAFDSSGNAWLTNYNGNTLIQYSAAQLTASGAPTPAITISANAGSLDLPAGLAIDNSGSLWITNANSSTLVSYEAAQLATSGSPEPAVIVSGLPALDVGQLAFSPPAANLPIQTP